MREYLSNQPFRYKELGYLSLFIVAVGIILTSLIFGKTIYDKLAFKALSEQVAPLGAKLFCSIGAIYFTAHIALKGPIENYNSTMNKIFIFITKFGLGLLFTYVSLMVASIISSLLTGYNPPKPFSLNIIIPVTIVVVLFAHVVYIFFALAMSNSSNSNLWNKKEKSDILRILNGMFCLVLISRSLMDLYIGVMQS
ncbi:hypothetical protein [Pseudoalteromonas sp. S1608]|uniref:hypothetical protein n=1 Tax=Pseudoalteromonas sp. S1608 TaxID=579504 RepID=UPI00110B3B78|nr:hypothetical protein [Pseudoalteromonas sp. S1608]TMP72451.1 hypothetical protein CWB75_16315 [Pseudoalteromonas sp. S1608]